MISVRRSLGLVTVQDAGRPGFRHLGIAPGGPLSPSLFRSANAAAGNDLATRPAAIEILGALEVAAEGDSLLVALDGGETRRLAAGESLHVATDGERRVRYLAVQGGLDVPVAFGGRGTLLVASLGGLDGRVLRKGDRLAVLPGAASRSVGAARPAAIGPRSSHLRILPGPDLDAFEEDALYTLTHGTFSVAAETDRVGTRLDGPRIVPRPGPRTRSASAPMVRGAIQVPPDGRPIVLGPDHPTTGGYPLIAVIVSDDVEHAVAAPVGAPLRFVVGPRPNSPAC